MTAQENVALARSQLELYNSHQTDPAWLDKIVAALAEDCEIIDEQEHQYTLRTGTTLLILTFPLSERPVRKMITQLVIQQLLVPWIHSGYQQKLISSLA